MEKTYTQQDIEKFLSNFRDLANPYKIEKVHQLLNNPHAKARYSVKLNYKPFNFIIMTSAFILGLSALIFWSNPKTSNIDEISTSRKSGVVREVVIDSNLSSKRTTDLNKPIKDNQTIEKKGIPKSDIVTKVTIDANIPRDVTTDLNQPKVENLTIYPKDAHKNDNNIPVQSVTNNDQKVYNTLPEYKTESCVWSPDTVVDKKLLLVDLSDKELRTIGIARKGNATFYHNIIEGKYDMSLTSHPDLIPIEERITTFNKYFVAYTTNSQFEPDGSGNFYSSMDTLVPVLTNNQAGQIFWFTPHDSFFNLLPERYNYLRSTYKNLICLKEKYPKRTFTNFLGSGAERVLDPVNVLNFNKDQLKKIGVLINDECVIFQTLNKNYTLKICKHGRYYVGNDKDSNVFPPNPYPVIMTDTLGRRLYIEGSILNRDTVSKIMNILVPVRINLNEIVPPNQEVIICWYYPTPEFLNALPGKIGRELESELNSVISGSKNSSTSCNYFETCKSSLKLNNFKLYPNPASSTVTIEFENSEEIIGSISIVNMAGLKLRELLSGITFLSGHNSYQMNLSGINSGIYLVLVSTNKGFKTQRLIVSQ
jgi:hypothetical protein